MNERISEMARPRSTKFGVRTSYICTQIQFISNFGYHAPFAKKEKCITLVIKKLETLASARTILE